MGAEHRCPLQLILGPVVLWHIANSLGLRLLVVGVALQTGYLNSPVIGCFMYNLTAHGQDVGVRDVGLAWITGLVVSALCMCIAMHVKP